MRISATPLIQAYQGGTFFIDAMQYTNRPLTIQDQISRLQNNGLIISDVAKAESELKNISYFRLADYLHPMESDHVNHTFKPGSKIEDAISMYYFDKELRSLIFNAIQTVEVALRSKMIQIASVNYGSHWYMDSSYFTKQDIFFDCFTKIGTEVKRSKEDFIKEYFSKYSVPIFPPVWKTLEVISFGTLSKIYENIKEKAVKKAIANEFQLPTHVIFESWVQCTAVLRNLCCHHNRVWNRRYAVKPQLPKTLPLAWITQFDPIPTKIYWQLCCLLYMENAIHPGNGFSQSLKSLFAKYPSVNPSAMGFPTGWDSEPLWK